MKLVELSVNNNNVDVIHKHHILQMEHGTSAPNERVLRTTHLAKLSFNHPSVVLTADVFQCFYKIIYYKKGSSFSPPIPFVVFALLFSLPPSRNADPGSHNRLFYPPTHYGSCLAFFSREDFSSFFPRRLASNCAYPR